jgi:Lon-like protease
MSRRGLTFGLAGVLLAMLIVLAAFLPVPYVVLMPGPVTDTLGNVPGTTKPVVSVNGTQTYPTGGHLYMTTVGVVPASCSDHPTLWQAIRSWFDNSEAVEPMQVQCPPGQSSTQVQQSNENDMSQSQRAAITAALLHLHYKPSSTQIIVADTVPGTPAAAALEDGDAILAVNGQSISGVGQLRNAIEAAKPGDVLTMRVERAGKAQDVRVKTVASNDGTHRTVIGIPTHGFDLRATFSKVDVKIGIDPAQVGGPSAGLAFALGIVDELTPGDLTGGRTVAVTGTIDGFGNVGPIGGIQQKIAGAKKAGATVFLAPASECPDARSVAPSSMTLVKVTTLSDALDALAAINSGNGSFPRC